MLFKENKIERLKSINIRLSNIVSVLETQLFIKSIKKNKKKELNN